MACSRRIFLVIFGALIFLIVQEWATAQENLQSASNKITPAKTIPLGYGAYVLLTSADTANPANAGQIANTGFIVSARGVIVIDSGTSSLQALAILAAIRKITPLPVCLLINTHPHPENVLGNIEFSKRGIPILASLATLQTMEQRCKNCFRTVQKEVGENVMSGTKIVFPNWILPASRRFTVCGRSIEFLIPGQAHSEGDLAVLDHKSKTIFAGGLLYFHTIPHLGNSNIERWQMVLFDLAKMDAWQIVPVHGSVTKASGALELKQYLDDLNTAVTSLYHRGNTLAETTKSTRLPKYIGWQGYQQRHEINVQHVYLGLEQQEFSQASLP